MSLQHIIVDWIYSWWQMACKKGCWFYNSFIRKTSVFLGLRKKQQKKITMNKTRELPYQQKQRHQHICLDLCRESTESRWPTHPHWVFIQHLWPKYFAKQTSNIATWGFEIWIISELNCWCQLCKFRIYDSTIRAKPLWSLIGDDQDDCKSSKSIIKAPVI